MNPKLVVGVAKKLLNGEDINVLELAKLIVNDPNILFSYLIDNNPASVNYILKNSLGTNSLGTEPERKSIEKQIQLLIEKEDVESLQRIINEFQFDKSKNNYTNIPELKEEIKKLIQ